MIDTGKVVSFGKLVRYLVFVFLVWVVYFVGFFWLFGVGFVIVRVLFVLLDFCCCVFPCLLAF